MDLTPDEGGAAERLADRYNENENTPANPLGLGRGAPRGPAGIFVQALRDIAVFGRGVVRVAKGALTEITAQAARFEAAVAAIETGPVTSVNGQVGDVDIDLSTISAEVETQLAAVRAAQDELEAAQAAIAGGAYTRAIAFGVY